MLVVFDVDGTLIGGESFDWASFDTALEQVAGFSPPPSFWESLEEVTAHAIATAASAAHPANQRKRVETLIQEGYLRNLGEAHKTNPDAFRSRPGAPELLKQLRQANGISLAIATGDWHATISLKLAASGLDVAGIPMATCSDCYSRTDIIKLAAQRAGRSLEDAIYVGDGTWDFRACKKLGIPFIGTGERIARLREAGATQLLPDLSPEPFWEVLTAVMRQGRDSRFTLGEHLGQPGAWTMAINSRQ
jgi:phosphoglycolate phosphatase-like HAD superfamily hydrolase